MNLKNYTAFLLPLMVDGQHGQIGQIVRPHAEEENKNVPDHVLIQRRNMAVPIVREIITNLEIVIRTNAQ